MEEVADVEWYHNEQEKYDGKAQMMLFGHTTRPYKAKGTYRSKCKYQVPKITPAPQSVHELPRTERRWEVHS